MSSSTLALKWIFMVLLISVNFSLTDPELEGQTADAIKLSPPDASPSSPPSDFRISMDSSGTQSNNLQYEFYREKCPQAEKIVRSTMAQLFTRNKNATAQILRLLFHDCFIESGGPFYPVLTGRRDSKSSHYATAMAEIPRPDGNISETLGLFSLRGFCTRETVALLGIHLLHSFLMQR